MKAPLLVTLLVGTISCLGELVIPESVRVDHFKKTWNIEASDIRGSGLVLEIKKRAELKDIEPGASLSEDQGYKTHRKGPLPADRGRGGSQRHCSSFSCAVTSLRSR